MPLEPGTRTTTRGGQYIIRAVSREAVAVSAVMPISVPIAERGNVKSDLIVAPNECTPPVLYPDEPRIVIRGGARYIWSADGTQPESGPLWPPTRVTPRGGNTGDTLPVTTIGALTVVLLSSLGLGDVRVNKSGAQSFQTWASYYVPNLWDRCCSNGPADVVQSMNQWLIATVGFGLSPANKKLFAHMFAEPGD